MNEKEFWLTIYRHLYGVLVAIRDFKLNEHKGKVEVTKPEATTISTQYLEKDKKT
jgi:hypothetical protein